MAADRMLLNPLAQAFQSKVFDLADHFVQFGCDLSFSCPVDDPFTVHVCADCLPQIFLCALADSGISYFVHNDIRFGLTAVLYYRQGVC